MTCTSPPTLTTAAQFFTVSDPRFQALVDEWLEAGVVRRWEGPVGTLRQQREAEAVTSSAVPKAAAVTVAPPVGRAEPGRAVPGEKTAPATLMARPQPRAVAAAAAASRSLPQGTTAPAAMTPPRTTPTSSERMRGASGFEPLPAASPVRYVASRGMRSIAKHLEGRLKTQYGELVQVGDVWRLTEEGVWGSHM